MRGPYDDTVEMPRPAPEVIEPRVPTGELPYMAPTLNPMKLEAKTRREEGERRKQARESAESQRLKRQQLWRDRRAAVGAVAWVALKYGVLVPVACIAFLVAAALGNRPARVLVGQVVQQGRVALTAAVMAIAALIAGCAPVHSAPAEEPYQLRCHDARWMVQLEDGDCFFWDQQQWSELIVCARESRYEAQERSR